MKNILLLFILLISSSLLIAQSIPITGDQYHLYGPTTTTTSSLRVGGEIWTNSYPSIITHNGGNLHIDSKVGKAIFLNHYSATNTLLNTIGGNVGIGNYTPLQKLHVTGNTYFDGSVGIGTATPLSKLHIEGGALRISTDANNFFYSGIDAGGFFFERVSNVASTNKLRYQIKNISTNIYTQFYINGENSSFNFMNGNVGIGISKPAGLLHVKTAAEQLILHSPVNSRGLAIKVDADNINFNEVLIGNASPTNYIAQSATIMTFQKATDYVGIGTTNPGYKLDVNGTINATNILVNGQAVSTGNSSPWVTDGNDINFATGNIGIGANTPLEKLDVNGNIQIGNGQFIKGKRIDGFPAKVIGYEDNSNILSLSEYSTVPDEVRIYTPLDNNQGVSIYSTQQLVFFRNDGNVGIGTTTPSEKLHIVNASGPSKMVTTSTGGPSSIFTERTDGSWCGLSSGLNGSSLIIENGQTFTIARALTSETPYSSSYFGDASLLTIKPDGNIGIGTTDPKSKLAVDGKIRATEVKVMADVNVPDYVFAADYKLRTLKETQDFIARNHHLPEIPSAAEIGEDGFNLGEMDMRLLKKIEELTLYQIELMEKMEAQAKELQKIQKELLELKK